MNFFFVGAFICAFACTVYSKEICDTYGSYYTYCYSGYYCCGVDKCCPKYASLTTGGKIGLAVGIVVFLFIVVMVCAACKCCSGKTAHSRNVIHVAPRQEVATITSTYGQRGYHPQNYQPGPAPHPPGYVNTNE